MNFDLSDEQQMVRDMARSFADKELAPHAGAWDEQAQLPKGLGEQLGRLGLMGVAVPEEYGGAGFDTVSYALAMEEISRGCASTGVTMSVNNSLACDPILKWGTEEQKQRWLKPMAQGKILGCFALSEPQSGSDAAGMASVAKKCPEGCHYVVNGTKNFVTNGPDADLVVLFCFTDKSKGHRGISAFVVDIPSKGLTIGPHERKLGIRASSTSQLIFDNVKVSAANMLGTEQDGFKIAMGTLDGGRIGIAAQAVGIARAAYEAALKYSNERSAFGAPLNQLQAIAFKLADMAIRIDASRLLALRAAAMKDAGARHTKHSAMAKLHASETAMWVTTQAIQVFGGYGYLVDYPVERHFRDAKITEIYEGTSEIQRLVIAAATLDELGA